MLVKYVISVQDDDRVKPINKKCSGIIKENITYI
jgi:hypothetical protein